MLAATFPTTPRPCPPARLRRASAQLKPFNRLPAPPPYEDSSTPYAPSLPTLLGSPLPATSQLLRSRKDDYFSADVDHDWVNEKSRGELSELLAKAGHVIKDREIELNMTSTICKNLFESNLILKAKHEALAARVPVVIRSPSPSSSIDDILSSPLSSPTPESRTKRYRRMLPASSSELDLLADQNAELLNKLEELEQEAASADRAGKRKLNDLEREIRSLRDELEKTREASKLDEQVHDGSLPEALSACLDDDLLQLWKKLDREARVRGLRARTRPWELHGNHVDTLKDFAPRNNLSVSDNHQYGRTASAAHLDAVDDADNDILPVSLANANRESEQRALASVPNQAVPRDGRELTIVSRLLLKIRELEETNSRMAAQHLETRLKLKQAEKIAENVRKVFEDIGEEAGIELEMIETEDGEVAGTHDESCSSNSSFTSANSVIDDDCAIPEASSPPRSTISTTKHRMRFRSVKNLRRLSFDHMGADDVRFAEGIDAQMRSTVRNDILTSDSFTAEPWMPPERDVENGNPLQDAPLLQHKGQRSRKSIRGLFRDTGENDSMNATLAAHCDQDVLSQTPHVHVTSASPGRPTMIPPHTSSSHLGAPNSFSFPSTPNISRSSQMSFSFQEAFDSIHVGEDCSRPRTLGSELGDEIRDDVSIHHLRSNSLYELLQDANKEDDDDRDEVPSSPNFFSHTRCQDSISLYNSLEILQQSFSSRFDDKRSRDTNTGESELNHEVGRSLPDRPWRQSTGGRRRTSSSSLHSILSDSSNSLVAPSLRTSGLERKTGFTQFLLELWLWLQFIVIITLFVWAMARRGPKDIIRSSAPAARTKTTLR